jgi:uroporphyrinogen-III synthase
VKVFDDGQDTYFSFRQAEDLPAIFAVDPDGGEAVVTRLIVPSETAIARAEGLARDLRSSRAAPAPARFRLIVTRAASQSDGLVTELAAVDIDAVTVPAVDIELTPPGGALDLAAGRLQLVDWVVVTSVNGVRAIVAAAERVLTELGSPRWAAVGAATATALERQGIAPNYIPSRADAATLARELPIEPGATVLVVRGDLAGTTLADALRRRGAEVEDVIGYRTHIAPAASEPLLRAAIAGGPCGVVLTSGSTVDGLLGLGRAVHVDVTSLPAICIGPRTSRSALEAGFRVVAEAETADAHALALTAQHAFADKRKDHA